MAKRSPLGSQEKSVTVSACLRHILEIDIENARRTLELDYFNRKVLLAHTENLKVAENRFFRFGMAVDTNAEKIALILPIQPTL